MLRHIQRLETDPYYNLAAEEYLLKTATADTFMIWRNEPSVIIGKHQNTAREINHHFIEACNIPVIRRITGGGTVYHDLGNINFSFIYVNRKENLIDFIEFTKPVILFLNSLGLNARFEGKNNITANGLKVSGNSAHIFKNKVLHHGTLLYDSDLDMLDRAIARREEAFQDKAVRSVRAKVANIRALLKEDISSEEFAGLFRDFIFKNYHPVYQNDLAHGEIDGIGKLAEGKYRTCRWNYGYSPEYHYNNEWEALEGKFAVSLFVKEGLIKNARINGPEIHAVLYKRFDDLLVGAFHEKKSVAERLKKLTFADEDEKGIVNQIVDHLF
jgi:lipoate---protein ligase